MLVCCQITFLIILCLFLGFLIGVWISSDYDVHGLPDLWDKFVGLFHSTKKEVQNKTSGYFGN